MKPDTLYGRDITKEMPMFENDGTTCLKRFIMNHSTAVVAVGVEDGKKWATVYEIETLPDHRGKGECTKLLKKLKEYADKGGYKFALWCPMNPTIEHICKKVGVETV